MSKRKRDDAKEEKKLDLGELGDDFLEQEPLFMEPPITPLSIGELPYTPLTSITETQVTPGALNSEGSAQNGAKSGNSLLEYGLNVFAVAEVIKPCFPSLVKGRFEEVKNDAEKLSEFVLLCSKHGKPTPLLSQLIKSKETLALASEIVQVFDEKMVKKMSVSTKEQIKKNFLLVLDQLIETWMDGKEYLKSPEHRVPLHALIHNLLMIVGFSKLLPPDILKKFMFGTNSSLVSNDVFRYVIEAASPSLRRECFKECFALRDCDFMKPFYQFKEVGLLPLANSKGLLFEFLLNKENLKDNLSVLDSPSNNLNGKTYRSLLFMVLILNANRELIHRLRTMIENIFDENAVFERKSIDFISPDYFSRLCTDRKYPLIHHLLNPLGLLLFFDLLLKKNTPKLVNLAWALIVQVGFENLSLLDRIASLYPQQPEDEKHHWQFFLYRIKLGSDDKQLCIKCPDVIKGKITATGRTIGLIYPNQGARDAMETIINDRESKPSPVAPSRIDLT